MRSTRLRSPRPDVPTWVHPRCDCGKVLTLDRDDAKKWRRIYADHNGNHNETRFYQCRYGTWHWTQDLGRRKSHDCTDSRGTVLAEGLEGGRVLGVDWGQEA